MGEDLDGLLERGRGAGYLAAVERGRSASDAVLRCVFEDPRWDRQIESRADYYASLLITLGATPVQPIVELLEQRERNEVWLAHDVLLQLAWRGHLGALAAAIERLRAGRIDANDLRNIGGQPLVERVCALAGRSAPPEPLVGPRPTLEELAPSLDVEQLLALLRGPEGQARVLAARRLGALDHADLLTEAKAFLLSQSVLPRERARERLSEQRPWMVYIEALPGHRTLELARAWFHADWPLSIAAENILIEHAEPDDRAMLEAAGAKALAEQKNYRLSSIVDALKHLADPRSIPLLATIYREITYSYARERVCNALLVHPERADVQALVFEGLWDCEQWTRALACENVEPGRATARLREIEGDPFEHDDVRDAARTGLEH